MEPRRKPAGTGGSTSSKGREAVPARKKFTHEEISAVPRGWKVRTVTHPSGAEVRLAFPPGAQRKGSGRVVSIIHPHTNGYNPRDVHLSVCIDPEFVEAQPNPILESILGGAAAGTSVVLSAKLLEKYLRKRNPASAALLRRIYFLEGKAERGRITPQESTLLRSLYIRLRRENPRAVSYLEAARKAAVSGELQKARRALGKYQRKKIQETEKELRRVKGRNPDGAAEAYRDFHGRSPTEVLEMQDSFLGSGDYTALGDDPEIWLRPVKGDPATWAAADIEFEPADQVKLATDPQLEQLYFVGRNQVLPLATLQRAGFTTDKRFVSLGEAHAISYTTEKSFDDFKSTPYAHIFGEETGERPTLLYDKETRRLLLVGGGYQIAPVDASLGASPGIVN